MSDEGYSLPDTLAALAILGLALGALGPGVLILAKAQIAIEQETRRSQAIRRGEAELAQLLAGGGPFSDRLGGLSGAPERLSFPCGAAQCSARLDAGDPDVTLVLERPEGEIAVALPGARGARFAYVGALAEAGAWPAGDGRAQRLRAIDVVGAAPADLILHARLWTEHGADCEFDVISQDCRG
jgi:hypothetical protein